MMANKNNYDTIQCIFEKDIVVLLKEAFSKLKIGIFPNSAIAELKKNYERGGFDVWDSSDGLVGVTLNWHPCNDAYNGISEQQKIIDIAKKTAEKYSLAHKLSGPTIRANGVYVMCVGLE